MMNISCLSTYRLKESGLQRLIIECDSEIQENTCEIIMCAHNVIAYVHPSFSNVLIIESDDLNETTSESIFKFLRSLH